MLQKSIDSGIRGLGPSKTLLRISVRGCFTLHKHLREGKADIVEEYLE
jgi:hypothetical protein